MGVRKILTRGAMVDFSRGSQNIFPVGERKWWFDTTTLSRPIDANSYTQVR